MKDERKTKKQLIEELEALRGQVADRDPFKSQLRPAVERVRAQAMGMRHSEDLLTVVAMMFEEAQRLGIGVAASEVSFQNPETDESLHYEGFQNPALSGISWTSPDLVAFSDETVAYVGRRSYRGWLKTDAGQQWQKGTPWVKRFTPSQQVGRYAERFGFSRKPHEWVREVTQANVPFDQGLLRLAAWEDHPQLMAVAEALTDALSLGFVRFLDLVRLEEQNRELTIQNALERVRSEVLSMRQTDDFEKVLYVLIDALREVGVDYEAMGINIFDEEAASVEVWSLSLVPGSPERTIRSMGGSEPLSSDFFWSFSNTGKPVGRGAGSFRSPGRNSTRLASKRSMGSKSIPQLPCGS